MSHGNEDARYILRDAARVNGYIRMGLPEGVAAFVRDVYTELPANRTLRTKGKGTGRAAKGKADKADKADKDGVGCVLFDGQRWVRAELSAVAEGAARRRLDDLCDHGFRVDSGLDPYERWGFMEAAEQALGAAGAAGAAGSPVSQDWSRVVAAAERALKSIG